MAGSTFFLTNQLPSGFSLDGAYISQLPTSQGLPQGPDTSLIGIVGTATDGPFGVPVYFSGENDLYAQLGNDTTTVKSGVRAALSAMPECKNFAFIRVQDGTAAPATLVFLDTAGPTPAHVLVLTAIGMGTRADGATGRIDLQSGSAAAAPIYKITLFYPGGQTQVFKNIAGSANGGAYSAAAFQANALAAINGTLPNSTPSPYFVATAGSSTIAPVAGNASLVQASGGTNGDSGVTDATLVGVDNGPSSTGMYALRGLLAAAQIVLPGLSDPTQFATVETFCQEENCVGWESFAAHTTTATAVANKQTNNMSADDMCVILDYLDVNDVFQGQTLLVSPIAKAAGIVAAEPPWMYVGNKPENGTSGVTSTERMALGALGQAEAAQREENNIMWIGKTVNGVMGLYHGLTSSGRQLNEIRMKKYLSVIVGQTMARFVGQMLETTLPIAQADENDARVQCASALRSQFIPMMTPGNRQISAAQVIINDANNSTVTMQQGKLIAAVLVTTLTGVQFAVGLVQVGNTVQLAAQTLSGN